MLRREAGTDRLRIFPISGRFKFEKKLDKKHLKVKEDAEDVDIDALMRKWMAPHIGEKWDTVGD